MVYNCDPLLLYGYADELPIKLSNMKYLCDNCKSNIYKLCHINQGWYIYAKELEERNLKNKW